MEIIHANGQTTIKITTNNALKQTQLQPTIVKKIQILINPKLW